MNRRVTRLLTWLGNWNRFCALMIALFLTRAVFLLSVMPPYEGWDEYQHIAYVAHWIEHGAPPVLGESPVPRALYPALVRFPQPKLAVDQIGAIGAMEYHAYWERLAAGGSIEVRATAPDIPLYQAQHPPLYYQLIAPLFRGQLDPDRIGHAIARARWLGVACGAAALLLFGLSLPSLVAAGPARCLILLAVATQPLLLFNCARVASDPLAVLLGTLVVVMVLEFRIERWRRHGLILGLALGLSILAKVYNLLLAPFVVLVWLDRWRRGRWRGAQTAASLLLILSVAILLTSDYFMENLRRHGLLTPMQESVENARHGVGTSALLRQALALDWLGELARKYLRQSLFTGGWSYVKTSGAITWVYQVFLLIGAGLAVAAAIRWRRSGQPTCFSRDGAGRASALLGALFAMGLAWHMVSSRQAWGSITTNVWYAAVSFPWLLCLYYQGAAARNRRAVLMILGGGLIVLHGSAETWGILGEMVPRYTGAPWGDLARERLASMHPASLGPRWTVPAMLVANALLWLGLFTAFARDAQAPRDDLRPRLNSQ
ncbi:MAG: hypothetical protein DCC66_12685 [Planctomycetota bacterium]|nr:MAG: hypothetical protein DCC66_12685 [Planctomycetota bacterium]